MATSQGYQCEFEFVEVVPEDLYCRKCSLVARRLTITDCCGDSFCHNCIAGPQQQNQPCPACGENNFNTLKQVKNQRRINQLMVYCSMKERGCSWSGTLEQLDTHLDPDQDNCQYVDTKCPLNCLKTIPKNKLDDHLAQHCVKRAYVCRYCSSFKATYEEVVDTHLPQCRYVPLDCPHRCGATFERDFFEDHMKMCRLEEVECELRGVGCGGRFLREDQEEHARQNSQKHLTLTASLAVETKEQLQQKLLELDQRHKEEEEKLKMKMEKKLEEQDNKFEKQEKKLTENEKKLGELEKKLGEQEKKLVKKLWEHEKKLGEQEKKLGEQEKKLVKKLWEHEKKLGEQEKMLGEQDKKLGEQEKKLGEQEKKLREQEKKLVKKLWEHEKKLGEQEKMLGEQDKKLGEQEKKLGEQEKKLGEKEKKLREQEERLEEQGKKLGQQERKLGEQEKRLGEQNVVSRVEINFRVEQQRELQELKKTFQEFEQKVSSTKFLHKRFEMRHYSAEKKKDKYDDWKSPAMYTHVNGYKFCVGVDANGCGSGRGKSIYVDS